MNSNSLLCPVSKQKLFTLSKLWLNNDILNIIQSYCYFNWKDAQTINFANTMKKKIHALILEAMSRNTDNFENHWAFGYPNDHAERLQLQAENCSSCGNYITTSQNFGLLHQIVLCSCDM